MGGINQGGTAKPYLGLNAFYSVATASITTTAGDSTYSDTTSARQLRETLGGNFGGTAALGGEYYFSQNFSVSGEFGVRLLFGGQKSEDEGYEYSYLYENNLGLGVTYTSAGLNFYF
ncbi:hypothetical protein CH330_02650 [candidate division WOR-3 bacterium JGI_Cruoil_03_51_56]|uniref:Outer membrane protein beta-barrel domain-containing protein n=1 Tax=candidate division WOR-3 bacterium JGI_Cruoil_03_51_56 TaxID=1973747 RepID=A0A235BXG0_UNCW3|nr:MAG: hypothetical protein CH330_02650 [candidate division WOR-3 bacterium JGI_Cruoil_03_51_56]